MKDRFGREINYLRLSVTPECNLRCRYCRPEEEEGIRCGALLTEDEMITAVSAAAELGITKLRITGGEPLLYKNILSLCNRISAVPGIVETAITTNGTNLAALAKPLYRAGVRRVNISLDTLDPGKYADMTGGGDIRRVLDGIGAALDAGFKTVKLNAVLIGGFNDDEIRALAEITKKMPLDVRFIELMPMAGNRVFSEDAYIPADTVLAALPELEPWKAGTEENRSTARLYSLPGAYGRVGLISPVSADFCAFCSRLRLTADGMVKPCLHSPAEYCLKGLDKDGMTEVFWKAVQEKPLRRGVLSPKANNTQPRPMNRIGG